MATAATSGADARVIKLTCSHSGRLVHCGPGDATLYLGGETRVVAVPRSASFSDRAHRLADDEGIVVSVTCDEELAHMVDEYDRLRATRPGAAFRVFVSTTARRGPAAATGPQPPAMRRVKSEQALAARAQLRRRPAFPDPAPPIQRVQSAQDFTAGMTGRPHPLVHRGGHHWRCVCHRCTQRAAVLSPTWLVYAQVPYMTKNATV
ncbi:hypothetical protein PR202_ga13070 [Eleusine coracana subsp. coracana]|uniref:PB1 domain-containing protein n=1 Tax=Eleusine coracana subsp. coracana TaxID=191504 RepID=A0AAV5CD26_ELECO|nr:hypothetical protein PR202_ga13070 [Eleusine coracana subsp. coracana]